jgi:RNA polymerase sigma-70 factor (ECF subfamily)
MSHKKDQHYVDSVLSGDTRAFSVLIDRYKQMVFTLALRIVKNREDAEEVAQDVFLKAFKGLKNFKGDSKFSTWLYKIAYHKSLDYLRVNKRKVETSEIDVSERYDIAVLDNAMDYLEASERGAMIREAIGRLAADDSVLMTMYYFEELSLKEISGVLGIAPDTAKVRLFRSRARLAELLKNKMEPEMTKGYERK